MGTGAVIHFVFRFGLSSISGKMRSRDTGYGVLSSSVFMFFLFLQSAEYQVCALTFYLFAPHEFGGSFLLAIFVDIENVLYVCKNNHLRSSLFHSFSLLVNLEAVGAREMVRVNVEMDSSGETRRWRAFVTQRAVSVIPAKVG